MDESRERQWTRRGFIVAGGALAGAVAISGVSNFVRPKPEPVSEKDVAMKRESKVLNTQIRVLNSLKEEDFNAITQGKSVQERGGEFMKFLDERFSNLITDVPSDVKTESRNRLIKWFRDDKDVQNASTPREMKKIIKMKQRLLGREFNSPKKESLNGVTDKIKQ